MGADGTTGRDEGHRVGFVVNPIAGMGGRVGLKGTDHVVAEAVARGAVPAANDRAREMLCALGELLGPPERRTPIHWLTCSGAMGAESLAGAGFPEYSVRYECEQPTDADDTRRAVERFVAAGVDLVVFCGGDGTARDVCDVTPDTTPVLGVPAGVKMYSGVFGVTPARTAQILVEFLAGRLELVDVEILDVDEERYRRGEWATRLHATAKTPFEPSYTQTAKALIASVGEEAAGEEIADELLARFTAEPETLFLLGPGSTVDAVARRLGLDKSLLGIDAVVDRALVGADLDERELLRLVDAYQRCVLVVSPIGAQGFVLGRGNQPLSPEVVRRIGAANLVVIATPAKLQRTPVLRFDTGDRALDAELAGEGYLRVVTGRELSRLVEVVG